MFVSDQYWYPWCHLIGWFVKAVTKPKTCIFCNLISLLFTLYSQKLPLKWFLNVNNIVTVNFANKNGFLFILFRISVCIANRIHATVSKYIIDTAMF